MSQQALLSWFANADLPRRPFDLAPHRRVTNPLVFFQTLRRDVERGVAGPHVHHGVVVETVRLLHGLFKDRRRGEPRGNQSA
jgi:hypothetical protein